MCSAGKGLKKKKKKSERLGIFLVSELEKYYFSLAGLLVVWLLIRSDAVLMKRKPLQNGYLTIKRVGHPKDFENETRQNRSLRLYTRESIIQLAGFESLQPVYRKRKTGWTLSISADILGPGSDAAGAGATSVRAFAVFTSFW